MVVLGEIKHFNFVRQTAARFNLNFLSKITELVWYLELLQMLLQITQ